MWGTLAGPDWRLFAPNTLKRMYGSRSPSGVFGEFVAFRKEHLDDMAHKQVYGTTPGK